MLRRMPCVCLIAVTGCSLGSSSEPEPERVRVRGELVWSSDRQTLTSCEDDRVYWVRVLASNPHDALARRVEALSAEHTSILADLEGEIGPVPSRGPSYPVDLVLQVRQTHAIDPGACSGSTVGERPARGVTPPG